MKNCIKNIFYCRLILLNNVQSRNFFRGYPQTSCQCLRLPNTVEIATKKTRYSTLQSRTERSQKGYALPESGPPTSTARHRASQPHPFLHTEEARYPKLHHFEPVAPQVFTKILSCSSPTFSTSIDSTSQPLSSISLFKLSKAILFIDGTALNHVGRSLSCVSSTVQAY